MRNYTIGSMVNYAVLWMIIASYSVLHGQDAASGETSESACKSLADRVREYTNAETLAWALDSRIQLIGRLNRACTALVEREISEVISLIREVPSAGARSRLARSVLPFLVQQPIGAAHSLIAALPESERDGAYLRLIESKQGTPAGLLQMAGNCTGVASFCPRSLNLAIYLAAKSDKSTAIALFALLISSLPKRELTVAEIEVIFDTVSLTLNLGEPRVFREGLAALRGVLQSVKSDGAAVTSDDGAAHLEMNAKDVLQRIDDLVAKISDYERRQDNDLRALAAELKALQSSAFNPKGGRAPARNIHEGRFEQDLEPYRIHLKSTGSAPAGVLRPGDTRGDVDLIHQLVASESRSFSDENKRHGLTVIIAHEQDASRTILRYHALKLALRWSCALRDAEAAYASANRLAILLNEYFKSSGTPGCGTCDSVYLDGMDAIVRELKAANLIRLPGEGLHPSVSVRFLLNGPTGANSEDRGTKSSIL